MKFLWWKHGSRLGAIALVGLTSVVAQAADDEKKEPKEQPRVEAEPARDVIFQAAPQFQFAVPTAGQRVFMTRAKLSDYWLGLDCSPVTPALRSHLKLDEGQGVVVENVMPESPAAKAEFKQHDLLLSAGEKPLKDVELLMTLLEENKDKEITFNVLRGGEKLTITVKPEKRPQPEGPLRDRVRWLAGDGEKAIEIVRDQLEKSGMPMRMQFFHPGVVVSGQAAIKAFPDDLHVHVQKHGNKPAEIVVERGDKHWTVTEDKLGELPEDVRPHIEGMLGRMAMPKFDVEIEGTAAAGPHSFTIPLPPPGELSERLENRMDELSRVMEQMRDQIQELREQRKEKREERRGDREERRDEEDEK